MKYIYVSAGEASGDLYGGTLIAALKNLNPHILIQAMGGPSMANAGAEIIQPISDLQIIGILEVVPQLLKVKRILAKLKQYFIQYPPELSILIDFPDFHFQIGKFLKSLHVPIFYYVSPQIWAWRSSRIKTIKRLVDVMIPLYEFEYNLYRDAGVPAIFYGHPLLDIVKPAMTKKEFMDTYQIPENQFILGLMPGSRISEIHNHMDTLITICTLINKTCDVTFLLIKAPSLPPDAFSPYNLPDMKIKLIEHNKYDAMKYSHLLLASSGTATVEACITGTPMIVFYRLNQLSWTLGRWLVKTKYLSMVNIIANDEIVPEFYQDKFQARPIADLIISIKNNPKLQEEQRIKLSRIKTSLGSENASRDIAAFILSKLSQGSNPIS